jgi:hypothetical protein
MISRCGLVLRACTRPGSFAGSCGGLLCYAAVMLCYVVVCCDSWNGELFPVHNGLPSFSCHMHLLVPADEAYQVMP